MTVPSCKNENCERSSYARGLCRSHYNAWYHSHRDQAKPNPHGTLEERFWRYVTKGAPTECWLWAGNTIPPWGYGQIEARENGSRAALRAHRVSYEIHHGPIPVGLVVRHDCDTPACVNPAHLVLGTQKQNVDDMMSRGRHTGAGAKGIAHGLAKLDDDKVRLIRSGHGGPSCLAAQFGVSVSAIKAVRTGRTWSHVT